MHSPGFLLRANRPDHKNKTRLTGRNHMRRNWLAALPLACCTLAWAAPQDDPIQPHPAMLSELADQSIVTDIGQAGDTLIAVGERGHILRSTDGKRWSQVESPVSVMLNRVTFVNDQIGWIGGHDATILKTIDGGQSWTLLNYQPELEQAVYDLHFFDADNGLAVGAYDLFWRTEDGGASWSPVDSPVGQGELHHYSITELADGTLLIAGERSMLARSTDQGQTWERVASPYFGSYFGAVPNGETGAIIFGLRGNVYLLPNIASLPTLEGDEYGEYPLGEIPDGQVTQLRFDGTDSLFNGVATETGALMVGVNGTIVEYRNGTSELTRVDGGGAAALGDIHLLADLRALGGETGLNHIDSGR